MANKYNWKICKYCQMPFIPYLGEGQEICSWFCEIKHREKTGQRRDWDMNAFEWNVKFINNIESNGLECWYTVQKLNASFKLYKIVPQFPADERGLITDSKTPEYYILFEGRAKKYEDRNALTDFSNYGDFIEDGHSSFIRVFKTLDEAKRRAVLQYDVIAAISKTYFPLNVPFSLKMNIEHGEKS